MSYQAYKIFDIPNFNEITKGIKIAECMKTDINFSEELPDSLDLKIEDLTVSDTLGCSYCNTQFENQIQQRAHYKLDWHRYNLKQRLVNLPTVTEDYFTQHADDVSSISGSESEFEDDYEVAKKFDKASEIGNLTESETDIEIKCLPQEQKSAPIVPSRHAKIFFENDKGEIFSLYKCLLFSKKEVPSSNEKIIDLAKNVYSKRTWAIIMLGGGHFAAGIFQGLDNLLHKTFHSYTVRAKQGGSQSSRDGRSAGSHPKSAGASLRRYNEASLTQHIQEILEGWSEQLNKCDLILTRAVGPSNRTILFGGKSPPLNKNDVRLRTIPFATRRATFKEVQRIHEVLCSLETYGNANLYRKIFPQVPNKKEKLNLEKAGSSDKIIPTPASSPKVTPERRSKTRASKGSIIDRAKSRELVKRPLPGEETNRALSSSSENEDYVLVANDAEISFSDNLKQFDDTVADNLKKRKDLKKNRKKSKISNFKDLVSIFKRTVQDACKIGDAELLENTLHSAESNIAKQSESKPSNSSCEASKNVTEKHFYEILNESTDDNGNTLLHKAAIDGKIKIIGILMKFGSNPCIKNSSNQTPYTATQDKSIRNEFRKFVTDFPEKYDYTKSQIPTPKNTEVEQELNEKKRALKKIKREKEKEKRIGKKLEQVEQDERERFLKLSDREKRAIAAERRILKQDSSAILKRCFLCGENISGKIPFEYSNNLFCSTVCLKAHRAKNANIL